MSRRAALALVLFLSACPEKKQPPPPPTLTRVELGGATALVRGPRGAVLVIQADGSSHPLAADSWVVPLDSQGERCLVRNAAPSPLRVGNLLRLDFFGGEVLRGPSSCAYARGTALVDVATGAVAWLSAADAGTSDLILAQDEVGRVYAGRDPGIEASSVLRYRLEGSTYVLDAPVSRADDFVLGFGVSTAGDVVYQSLSGPNAQFNLCLKSSSGPLSCTAASSTYFSDAWRGPDGALRMLRRDLGVVPTTTELLRFEFDGVPETRVVASWTSPQNDVLDRPVTVAGVPVLLGSARLRPFADPDAAPVDLEAPLSLDGGRVAFGGLWFAGGARVVRWTPGGGFEEVLPASGYEVRAVVPYASASALVRVRRDADGAELWLRATLGQEPVVTDALSVQDFEPGTLPSAVALD